MKGIRIGRSKVSIIYAIQMVLLLIVENENIEEHTE